ncbi:hypothetical protein ENBRE01_2534 [Enteropsectra breve]|nr:hypothetical protein ENBRE01_2534 [Enteropsectra breve]
MRGVLCLLQSVLATDLCREEVRPDEESTGANPSIDVSTEENGGRAKILRRTYLGGLRRCKDGNFDLILDDNTTGRNALETLFGDQVVGSSSEESEELYGKALAMVISMLEKLTDKIVLGKKVGSFGYIFTGPGILYFPGIDHFKIFPQFLILKESNDGVNIGESQSEKQLSYSCANDDDNIGDSQSEATEDKLCQTCANSRIDWHEDVTSAGVRPRRMLFGIIAKYVSKHAELIAADGASEQDNKAILNYFGCFYNESTISSEGEEDKILQLTLNQLKIIKFEKKATINFASEYLDQGFYMPLYTKPGCLIMGEKAPIPNFIPTDEHSTIEEINMSEDASKKSFAEIIQSLQRSLSTDE